MESILIFNTGSTSLSFHRYTAHSLELIYKNRLAFDRPVNDRKDFLKMFRTVLREIGNVTDVLAIGHRVVHGGFAFVDPVVIDDASLAHLNTITDLAPLHNPWNIAGIEACREYLADIPNIAVFDTAFFAKLPDSARIYGIPEQNNKYLRFGFHGISHANILEQLAEKCDKPTMKLTFISCHLGGGSSIALVEKGIPIDTSMGFSPLEGLLMMTRSGDVDPGIIFALAKEKLAASRTGEEAREAVRDLESAFYKSAGLKALSGCDSYLDLLKKMEEGDGRASQAFALYTQKIRKYIGAYAALVPKLDAICFTGSVGAGEAITRNTILKNLGCAKGVPVHVFQPGEEFSIAKTVRKMLELD